MGQLFSTLPAIISLNKALLNAVSTSYTQAEESNRGIDSAVTSLVEQNGKLCGNGGGHCALSGATSTVRGSLSIANLKRKECLIADALHQMVRSSRAHPSSKSNQGCCVIWYVFATQAGYLKVYTTYSSHYADAITIIKRNQATNPSFVAFLEEAKALPECRGRDMETLMLRPIQRLCQYISILEKLTRCTPRTHGDFDLLAKAAGQIIDVARGAEENLLTLALPSKDAKDADQRLAESTTPVDTPQARRGRRKAGYTTKSMDRALLERRRDGLAESFNVKVQPDDGGSTPQGSGSASGESKLQVSWKRFLQMLPNASCRDERQQDSARQRESLQALLDRETRLSREGDTCGASARKGLRRGGSGRVLGHSATHAAFKAQPRRAKSSVSLCRLGEFSGSTGTTFKIDGSSLVC